MHNIRIGDDWYEETFKKIDDGIYRVYVNDIVIGDVFKTIKGWSGLPIYVASHIGAVHGFSTRADATTYILQYCNLIRVNPPIQQQTQW